MPTTYVGPVSAKSGQLREDWLHSDGKAHARLADSWDEAEGVTKLAMLSWDTVGLAWVRFTGASGGGAGGAVTMADGASVTQGAKADAAWDGAAAAPTAQGILKYLGAKIEAVRALLAGTLAVSGPLTDAQLRAAAVSVTANAGTNLNTSALALDATLTGGAQRTKLTDGANNVGVQDSTSPTSEATADRLKVNAALRVLDTAQAPGSQLVAAKGDQTSGLWVNAKAAVLPPNAAQETGGNLTAIAAGVTTLDADLKAEIGALSATPGAYTLNDRLNQLLKTNATEATMQKLLAAMTKAPAAPPRPLTLLHR